MECLDRGKWTWGGPDANRRAHLDAVLTAAEREVLGLGGSVPVDNVRAWLAALRRTLGRD